MRDLRPLDPLRSIKMKLGVLVVTSVVFAGFLTAIGIAAGIHARYVVSAAVIASLAVTQVLAHGMTSPLRLMADAATSMAQGDYSQRVRATSRDEVGRLALAFNQMAADLQAVDQHRRELIANVSHELRTPISALRATLENVVDGVTEPDTAAMRVALEQAERLGRLVDQLLDLSRLDAGATPLTPERFAVRPFLRTVVRGAEAAGRSVRFVVDVEPTTLTGYADPERLHQVVANLLDNAAKHSPEGGHVTVRARPAADEPARSLGALRLEVADQGPGIPAEERTRVFERFARGGGTSPSDGGTGLGLAIARWAVTLHGGEIAVAESEAGCLIRVDLPGATDLVGRAQASAGARVALRRRRTTSV